MVKNREATGHAGRLSLYTRTEYYWLFPRRLEFTACHLGHGVIEFGLDLRGDQVCEVWTRVMGYHRPVSAFNAGKRQEFADRAPFEPPVCPRPAGESSWAASLRDSAELRP